MNPHGSTAPPSEWVKRFAHLIPAGGAVLDLAAGGGRHGRFLHGLGYRIVAVDRDLSGMADLAAVPGFALFEADLESEPWPLPARRFAGIVVTNYLHRALLPVLADSLAADGALIYETFAIGQAQFGRPTNPDFLLKPGELLDAFGNTLTIVAYEHGVTAAPAAVQRIAAVAGGGIRRFLPVQHPGAADGLRREPQ